MQRKNVQRFRKHSRFIEILDFIVIKIDIFRIGR